MFVELHVLSSEFGKAGEQIAKEMWEKEDKMVLRFFQPPVKVTGRSKESVSASKGAVDGREADDYAASIQPDKP